MPVLTILDPGAGSWTPLADVDNSVMVELWAAAAGGTTPPPMLATSGRGGGGGAYTRHEANVAAGVAQNYYVGAGGTAGADGEDTQFAFSASAFTAVAKGGDTGSGAGGLASEGNGDIKYSGGNGGNGFPSHGYAGGGGAAAGTSNNGADGVAGASSSGGEGGVGVNGGGSGGEGGQGNGADGEEPGGGGGGAQAGGGSVAGRGANGKIVITYSLRPPPSLYRSRNEESCALRERPEAACPEPRMRIDETDTQRNRPDEIMT